MQEEEKGLSTSSLVLLFLLGVVVCAVFFSFGFLLGYRERSSTNTAEVERVTPTGDSPPAVNPPPAKVDTSCRFDCPAARGRVRTERRERGLQHQGIRKGGWWGCGSRSCGSCALDAKS